MNGNIALSYRTVYITERCRCSYQNGYLLVRQDEQTMVHLSEISMVVIESTAAYVSSYLMSELAKARIPVVFCDTQHNPIGQYSPIYGAHNSTKRIREQIAWDKEVADHLWQRIIMSKIHNQAAVLERLGLAQATLLYEYERDVRSGDVANREGHAAKVYFNALFGNEFNRDKECTINAQLNYGYSILLAWLNREITARGQLTQIGINHCNEYNHFNLSCDFMEPFRPVIDWYVVNHSEQELNKQAKAELLTLFDDYYVIEQGKYRLSSILSLFTKTNLAILAQRSEMDTYVEFALNEG